MATTMLEAALAYAEQGIPVFPCGDDRRPLTTHGFKDATTNPSVIKRRWKRWPNAMIGMPTGPASGISVLDLDKKNGKNGFLHVPDWKTRSSVIALTMSNGAHLYFKDDGTITSTTSKIADGVDTRGKGGYVILPPSKGYKYLNGQDFSGLPKWPDDLRPPERKTVPKGGKRIKNRQPVEKAQVIKALDVIPSDNYQIWFEVGCALFYEFGDDGFELFDPWSKKSDKYDVHKVEAKWGECEKISGFTVGTIFHYADASDHKWRGSETIPENAKLEDFVANLAMHNYIYLPTNQGWPAVSVNARLGKQTLGDRRVTSSTWLDKERGVQSITWSPGDPQLIHDRVIRTEGGWIDKPGDMTLNQYTPPTIKHGDPRKAKPWVDLVHKLYPGEANNILDFFAQRVQQPGIKINHAIIFGGAQRIGKDTIIEGVVPAIGSWNFADVTPRDIMSKFNGFVKSILLRINEAHDLGEINRFAFYEAIKQLTASPPFTIPCEEKHMNKYAVLNVVGVIYTTNHKLGGIYLPEGDRRHLFAWSEVVEADFPKKFFDGIYAFYRSGGWEHIAAYLHARDISKFDPKVPPPQTEAWHDVVEGNRAIESQDFLQVLYLLSEIKDDGTAIRPTAISLRMIKSAATADFMNWLKERKNARAITYRLSEFGYVQIRNPAGETSGKRASWQYRDSNSRIRQEVIYVMKNLSLPQQVSVARRLIEDCKLEEPKWLKTLKKNKPEALLRQSD